MATNIPFAFLAYAWSDEKQGFPLELDSDFVELVTAPFAAAARRSSGQLIANGRIPIQAIIASIEADEALATEGS